MTISFESSDQERLFLRVVSGLESLGYRGELLSRSYFFADWFLPETPEKQVPVAAFGRTPQAYDSACFAVLLANGKSGSDLIHECRALGAPLAFEVRNNVVVLWKVGRDHNTIAERRRILPNEVERVFKEQKEEWSSRNVLRLKNIGFQSGLHQLDFIDLGLIPALEHEISEKLHALLGEVITQATVAYKKRTSQVPDEHQLFRLVFRFLAAKVLHDRGLAPFRTFSDFSDVRRVLAAVNHYYGEQRPILSDVETQTIVATNLWNRVDFRNLSVEALAYIYENTLVDKAARREMGIHSTPHSVARYIVHRLPFEKIEENARRVVEPFAGHGIFLVAALQRLRDLLPSDMPAKERHRYFVKMLQGFERDAFALEVATLCLMLADFPNPNGWRLHEKDVFASQNFPSAVCQASVILSNPPFEDCSFADRSQYQALRSVSKPVEFLLRLLAHLPPHGMLGLVLPRQFVDGRSYREVRHHLAQRFEEIEVVTLPDRVFRVSQVESALLLAKTPRLADRGSVSVTYTEVMDKDRKLFLTEYGYTRRERREKTTSEAEENFSVLALGEIWDRLASYPCLRDVAEIHRGIEWQSPFDLTKYLSPTKKPGFERGLHSAAGNFFSFQTPPSIYLCTKSEYRRGNAFDLPWERPKVIMNAVRVSRGPWRLTTFPDETGLLCTQNFHALWLQDSHWTIKSLASVLNTPVACAFVAAHEGRRHIRKTTLDKLPLPRLGIEELETLDRLVDSYLRIVEMLPNACGLFNEASPSQSAALTAEEARQTLLRIDALVLKGYNLPPRLERQLLDFFRGAQRPVPFPFEAYFPESFSPTLPLWMYLSPEYKKCSVDHFLQNAPKITDPVLIEAFREVE